MHLSYFHDAPNLSIRVKTGKTVCGLRVASSKFTCDSTAATCPDCRAIFTTGSRALLALKASEFPIANEAALRACREANDARAKHYRGR